MAAQTPLTLYFLQASRSIRIAWLLEELRVPYESVFFPRIENKAPSVSPTRPGSLTLETSGLNPFQSRVSHHPWGNQSQIQNKVVNADMMGTGFQGEER